MPVGRGIARMLRVGATSSAVRRDLRTMRSFRWGLTTAWAVHIVRLPTVSFRGNESRSVMATLLDWWGAELTLFTLRTAHAVVRKGALVAESGFLTRRLCRSLAGADAVCWRPRGAPVCVAQPVVLGNSR